MKKDSLWPAVTFLVLYTGLLFAGFSWMLKAQVQPIRELLTNHITGTNQKIEQLTDRIDNLTDRFDRLYELLLKDKDKDQK